MNKDLQSIKPDRPNNITSEIEAIHFYRKMDVRATVIAMIEGKYVLVEEYFSNGLQVFLHFLAPFSGALRAPKRLTSQGITSLFAKFNGALPAPKA